MMIALHKNARTTPATRAEMAASTDTAATLSLRYGVSEGTPFTSGRATTAFMTRTTHPAAGANHAHTLTRTNRGRTQKEAAVAPG